jgi:pimeloyl-ACP methyl ester carboxylesterase
MLAHIERCATAPILGPLFVRTLALPLGKVLLGPSVQSVFAPQLPPLDYLERTGAELILRPSEFVANAEDLGQLRRFLEVEAPRYATIEAPTIVLTGDHDEVVLPELHAKAIAAALPHGKLVVLPGVGHMVQFAAPERVVEAIAEIDKIDARNKGRIQRAGR